LLPAESSHPSFNNSNCHEVISLVTINALAKLKPLTTLASVALPAMSEVVNFTSRLSVIQQLTSVVGEYCQVVVTAFSPGSHPGIVT
jgi:hypothetical protein